MKSSKFELYLRSIRQFLGLTQSNDDFMDKELTFEYVLMFTGLH